MNAFKEVRTMKKLLVLIVIVVAASVLMGGCITMAETAHQREMRIKLINDLQARMFVEDSDTIWLVDRNLKMTRYHPRVGM